MIKFIINTSARYVYMLLGLGLSLMALAEVRDLLNSVVTKLAPVFGG